MSFYIPKYKDLVIEQLDIVNLPTNRNWVIQGGPGTGKTVMAIFRAQQISKYKKTAILVYNRPLKLFLEKAVAGTNCEVKTYNEWISETYYDCFRTKQYPHIDRYKPDFVKVEKELLNVGIKYDHIIIDEAQDCPIELLRTVTKVSKNITCFVDPNQEILKDKTGTVDLIRALCVPVPYVLTRNFRNTKQIRDASALFCLDGAPAHAVYNGKRPTMVKCSDYEDMYDYICEYCVNNRENSIGIIVDAFSLKRTYETLSDRLGNIIPVQKFKNVFDSDFDFSKNGVQIFSYGTMKGLEFDSVIIARIDCVYKTPDDRRNYNQLYVATSRPRQDLKVIYFSEHCGSKWINAFTKINNNRDVFDWEEN